MKRIVFFVFLTLVIQVAMLPALAQTFSPELFRDPTIGYRPRPLWFWNNTTVTAGGVTGLMEAMRDKCGYGGFGVVPFGRDFRPEYLSGDYLKIYGAMLEKAKQLGMTISLYDEFGFPSGSVGAFAEGDNTPRFALKYPDLTIQRLDKTEETVKGPATWVRQLPQGTFMGAVAMSEPGHERIDLTGNMAGGSIEWKVPSGTWKIMIFTCVIDGVPIADYLNPEAISRFTGMVHDVYYRNFREYFGNVIYGTFYDEPSMFHSDFRMWTPAFNSKFTSKYGFSPVLLYPALWYDIGPETESARNYLFGFRADLYANGFNRVTDEWSVSHGITATGHTAPEEALVPANSAGDLMKAFKYQEIPGIDKIGGSRPAERFYKLISSAACNWDRKFVMSETYGAMPDYEKPGDLSWDQLDSIAIDQYSKGINMLIPHAVWYDNTRVTYKPELSHRNPLYADSLKYFTTFLSRLNVMLQNDGRHVADIAVLYPVTTLLSEHYFYTEPGPATIDGPVDPSNEFYRALAKEIDYIDIANWLSDYAGKDFTFLHPEVLDEKCSVKDGILHLENRVNYEDYRILIVPSCRLLPVSVMKKIAAFYESGGVVIFTTRMPSRSAENGRDNEISKLSASIFPGRPAGDGSFVTNAAGGKACFIEKPDAGKLELALKESAVSFDVSYQLLPGLQYLHKVIDGRNVYYFANVSGKPADARVMLRGAMTLGQWDPHTGNIIKAAAFSDRSMRPFTRVRVVLKPFRSVFLVEDKAK